MPNHHMNAIPLEWNTRDIGMALLGVVPMDQDATHAFRYRRQD